MLDHGAGNRNPALHVLAEEVRTVIKSAINRSKYYALIVDSTPDVSHVDQLTIILRYVDGKGFVHERFLAFLSNTGHKGHLAVIDFLTKNDFTIINSTGAKNLKTALCMWDKLD